MGIFDGIRAAGTDASRQRGLYYAIEADKSATEAAAKRQALTKKELGGITKGLHEITMLAQEDHNRGVPEEQQWDYGTTQKQIMADPNSGYGKLLNEFVRRHPGVYRKLTSHPNRDMSEFTDNPIDGVKLITDFSGYGNADELKAQYPNGAYQINLRKRANTMPENIMGGLASVLPESMEELVPWTRNASSDPNDAMELIPYEDMNEEIQRQQRLYGNTSPSIANLHAEQTHSIGGEPNLYAPDPRLAAFRATEMNAGNITSKEFDDASFGKPRENFAKDKYSYKQALDKQKLADEAAMARTQFTTNKETIADALKGVTGKGSTPTDQIVDMISDIVAAGNSGKIKGIPRFNLAQQAYEQLTNIVNHPNVTVQQQQAHDGYLPKLKRQMNSSIVQYAEKQGFFKTGVLERWDAEWFSSIPEEIDETVPLSRAIRIVRENPLTGNSALPNDWGKEYVYLLKANGEEYADPEPLASFPTGMQEYLRREVGGAESPAPVDTSTNANINNFTPEQQQAIVKAAENINKSKPK